MGVFDSELALRREAEIAMPALDDRRAEFLLELTDRRRQGRLRDVAGLGRAAKMLLARQRDEIFELPDQHGGGLHPGTARVPRAPCGGPNARFGASARTPTFRAGERRGRR